jgi:hypothetical protein
MIPALLKGKLSREQENMEDLLTSTVFGVLRYVPYASGLYKLLEHVDNQEFLRALPSPNEAVDVHYDFWPALTAEESAACEPDLIITLVSSHAATIKILVEVKHLSEKSSIADPESSRVTDQLAKEWLCFVKFCNRGGGRPLLLYLTGHHGRPDNDIEEACAELHAKQPTFTCEHPMQCGWLSWRHLARAFENPVELAQQDLLALAERMDFRFFNGIHSIFPHPQALWRFRQVFRFGDLSPSMPSDEFNGQTSKMWSFVS